MGGIECHWWKFWRRLRALTEQLPRPVALAGGFEVPTGGSALNHTLNIKSFGESTVIVVLYRTRYRLCHLEFRHQPGRILLPVQLTAR
jgi:hypothetical protein